MSGKKRTVKLTKAYYSYHPDFKETDSGYEILPTGKWVVEWTIKEFKNPIEEHYSAKFQTEEEARVLWEELNALETSMFHYNGFGADSILFRGATHKELINLKKLAIEKDRQCEYAQAVSTRNIP